MYSVQEDHTLRTPYSRYRTWVWYLAVDLDVDNPTVDLGVPNRDPPDRPPE